MSCDRPRAAVMTMFAGADDVFRRAEAGFYAHAEPSVDELQKAISYYTEFLSIADMRTRAELKFRIGVLYMKINDKKSRRKGAEWLHEAAMQQHAEAAYRLGAYRLASKDDKVPLLLIAARQGHQKAIGMLCHRSDWSLRSLTAQDRLAWMIRSTAPDSVDYGQSAHVVRKLLLCGVAATRILRGRGGPFYRNMHDESFMQHMLVPLTNFSHSDARLCLKLPYWLVQRAYRAATMPEFIQLLHIVDGASRAAVLHMLLKDDEVPALVQCLQQHVA